jgi:HNH endonuclease
MKGFKVIKIVSKTHGELKALVDNHNLYLFIGVTWGVIKSGNNYYISRKKEGKTIYLHSEIMNCPKGKEIDHINGNGLDNRECNLRICSHSDNLRNRAVNKNSASQYKGVCKYKNGWAAIIRISGNRNFLGFFPLTQEGEIMAAKAYNKAASEHYGEFARLNKFNSSLTLK